MAWLRVDDLFDTHPKIIALGTDERRWTWTRVLLYTCRYRSPIVPPGIAAVIPKATPTFLAACVQTGLLDEDEDGTMRVHDWREYNGSDSKLQVRERVRRHRERNAEVTPPNADVTPDVTDDVTQGSVTSPLRERSSRAAARARPVPSPNPVSTKPAPATASKDPAHDDPEPIVAPAAGAGAGAGAGGLERINPQALLDQIGAQA